MVHWTDLFVMNDIRNIIHNGTPDLREKMQLSHSEIIDREMAFPHSTTEITFLHPSQDGLEHFIQKYGSTYKTFHLDFCSNIRDYSCLARMPELENLMLHYCVKVDKLWDISQNRNLKIVVIHQGKHFTENASFFKNAPSLEEIWLYGGDFDNKHTLPSLNCFEGMKNLRQIYLFNIKLQDHDFGALATLPALEEFHFDSNMLTTEEIAWIHAKYPHLHGDCLRAYAPAYYGSEKYVRPCGKGKPELQLPEQQKRLDKYVANFNALVEKYRSE